MSIVIEKLGYPGKIISGSKSGYFSKNPKNLVVFNANLISISEEKAWSLVIKPVAEKIWYGDIDITRSRKDLIDLSFEIDMTLLVLYEMDARFDNEYRPLIENFVYKVTPEGKEELGKIIKKSFKIDHCINRL
jgi:hypothetical protein